MKNISCSALPKLFLSAALSLALLASSILPVFNSPISEAWANPASPAPTSWWPDDLVGQELVSFGVNSFGQLGLGDTVSPRPIPEQIGDSNDWLMVAVLGASGGAIKYPGYIYTWGSNQGGPLGQGDEVARHTPTRVGSADNWVRISGYGNHFLALNEDGELWGWGGNTNGQVGVGFNSPPLGGVLVPTRIGTASNWVDISAGNQRSFAVNDLGELWAWGDNLQGRLGGGPAGGGVPLTATTYNTPRRVGTGTDWAYVSAGNTNSGVVTHDGHLYTWGTNTAGSLGQGLGTLTVIHINVPTRVGTADNWSMVAMGDNTSFAINDLGELWGWGTNGTRLGLGAGDTAHRDEPVRIGTASNWEYVASARTHSGAITECSQLWLWGDNLHGQQGNGISGSGNAVPSPTRLGMASNWLHVATGSNFTVGVGPYEVRVEVPITKTLRMPSSVTTPNVTFNFEVESFGWKPLTADNFLPILPPFFPEIDDPSISFTTADTGTVVGDVRTVSRTFPDVLGDVTFTNTGIYAWVISEVSSTPPTTDPYSMSYSSARYKLRVYVQQGIIRPFISAATLTVLDADNPSQVVGSKVGSALFTNTLLRVVGTPGLTGHNALELQKLVVGQYAPTTQFQFTLNLVEPTLGGIFAPLNAQVVNIANPAVSLRSVTFTGGSASFHLYHNERLVIPQLYANTGFNAVEIGNALFSPEATVILGGNFVAPGSATTPTYSEDPGDNIVTGTHVIANTGRNAIEFVNVHLHVPPTGLWVGNGISLWMIIIPAAALATLTALNYRKRIERLSDSEHNRH